MQTLSKVGSVAAAIFALAFLFPTRGLTQTGTSQLPPSWKPIIYANGWNITGFALNNRGTVVVVGGGLDIYPDGLILLSETSFTRIISGGDPVPGAAGRFFSYVDGNLINDQDEVVFTANYGLERRRRGHRLSCRHRG